MPRRVLVADDEPLTAEIIALMLAFSGYEVDCAHDGVEALEQARKTPPDVILLDVLMPNMGGIAASRMIRSDPALSNLPVILFSSADETEVAWQNAGADMFLQKPIDIRALPDIVRSVLIDLPPEVTLE